MLYRTLILWFIIGCIHFYRQTFKGFSRFWSDLILESFGEALPILLFDGRGLPPMWGSIVVLTIALVCQALVLEEYDVAAIWDLIKTTWQGFWFPGEFDE